MKKVDKVPTVFDTTQQQVGEVYARALLGLGKAVGKVDQLMDELRGFEGLLRESPRLGEVLQSPQVAVDAKERLVRRVLEQHCSREFLNFVQVLVRKGRFYCLSAVRIAAEGLADEMANRVRGVATTAAEMSDAARDQLAARLGQVLGKQVVLSTAVDPEIIGGVVVRVGDTVYDASVANQLRRLKSKAAKRVADSIRQSLERFASEA